MFVFLSSLAPGHFTQEEIKQNQKDYLLAFKSWQHEMAFDDNYLFLDNTLTNISEIDQKELQDICWQVYEFGAVRPFIRLANSGFSKNPDLGSINLLKALAADRYFNSHTYSVIILGKRRCSKTLKNAILNWLEKDVSNGLYFKDIGNQVIDNVVVIRSNIFENIVEFIANQNYTLYSSLIDSIAENFNLNLETLDE
jgi:hypothetical protein